MKAYERTHPWLSFSFDTRKIPGATWIALGEARSKCEHLAGVPLVPSVAKKLNEVYLAKGVHATAAIEGNTLSEGQVFRRIQKKEALPASQEYLGREIDNILAACNDIVDRIASHGYSPITAQHIIKYNAAILSNLELEDHVSPGEYRKVDVGVMDYRAPGTKYCDELVETFCNWLNSSDFKPPNIDDTVVFGIMKSVVAHIYFAWIHPFGDGNGRTARLLEVRFLMEAGVPMPAAHLLSNHYNLTRAEYYRRLSEASKNGGDLSNFLHYAVRGLVDQLRKQLRFVKFQQWGLAWQSYVHEMLGDKRTKTTNRQFELIRALDDHVKGVSKSKIKLLTPSIAREYAKKTPKTLSRDLNALEKLELITIDGDSVRPNKQIILAFLPAARAEDQAVQQTESERLTSEVGQLMFDFF